MKKYSLIEIAELFNINEETVRRWIRSGRLKASIASKKDGYVINELDLYMFARTKPKYMKVLNLSEEYNDDTYTEGLTKLLNELIQQRDRLNDRINKIQALLEET